jgi:Fe-S-cluster containining protein
MPLSLNPLLALKGPVHMDVHFDCTMCGKCCHGLKLPLSIDEAITWVTRSGEVQILCEAIPWPEEPPADDLQAQRKRRRSFAAASGDLPIRVIVTLAASFDGACPHLGADFRCGNYELRPRVCRIYPAEVNPFVELMPQGKACPPEAWSEDKPLLMKANRLVDAQTQVLIDESRAADVGDVGRKAFLCAELGVDSTSLANEGFAIYSPERGRMLAALQRAVLVGDSDVPLSQWTLVSNRSLSVETLAEIGAVGVLASVPSEGFSYLGFSEAS